MANPTTLGRYTLLRRLAAGGMGEVYLAEAQGAAGFSRKVAIKRILPHLARDEDFVRKFIDEANIMVHLHHGNIVGVQELADHDGELYIVMEYLPGRDLKAVIHRLRQRRRVMPPDLALWLTAEICAALDYAHRKTDADGQPLGIVHRDVSPSNVVLGAAGEVKLLDFGIARARGRLHQSISGTLQGKFVYMSPEQADGRPVDGRSDVFSAGLLLYELLTGVRPFDGDSETETLRKVRQARVDPPSQVSETPLDPALDPLVMGALAVEPEGRYATAADMRRTLLHHLADRRSQVDARHLADLLAGLFPEGVVPAQTADPPLSIDDALALQLGALTPNVNPMTRTRTADPPPRTPAAGRAAVQTPAPLLRSEPSLPRAELTPTPTQAPQPPEIKEKPAAIKRTLSLGLVVGALLATGVSLWWVRRGEASLSPTVEGPATWEVLVNGGLLLPGTRYPVGEKLQVCVRAEGYVESCRAGLVLERGQNRPDFKLVVAPVLEVTAEPATPGLRFTANGVSVDRQPYALRPGKDYEVCVLGWPDGMEPETRCQTVARVEKGTYSLKFRLLPARVDAGAPPDAGPSVPDAGAEEAPDAKVRTPHRPVPRITELVLNSNPSASVRCDDGTAGPTPLNVTARSETVSCRLTAEGYLPFDYRVEPNLGNRRHTVELLRPALLSARAEPGAARLLLDGRPLPDSYVVKLPVSPGRHRLEATIEKEGRLYRKEEIVDLSAGEEKSILVRIADYPAGGAEP